MIIKIGFGIFKNLCVKFLKIKKLYVIKRFVFINEKFIGFLIFVFFEMLFLFFVFIRILLFVNSGFFFRCFIKLVYMIVMMFLIIVVGIICDIKDFVELFKI